MGQSNAPGTDGEAANAPESAQSADGPERSRLRDFELPSYRAPRPLRHPALMTVAAAMPRPWLTAFARDGSRQEFVVDDGVRVVGFAHLQPDPVVAATVVLCHGLAGSAESTYMLGCAYKLHQAGFNVLRMNARNCGGTEALSRTIYNGVQSSDLARILGEVPLRFGSARSYLVGFSLGGSLALRMAGTQRGQYPPGFSGLVAISAPLELESSSRRMQQGHFNRRLTRRFLGRFRELLERRAEHWSDDVDLRDFDAIETLWEFDSRYTAPLSGFASVNAYYASASAISWISDVDVPGLVLHALDDPLVAPAPYGDSRVVEHPSLRVEVVGEGGHVGFLSGVPADGPRGKDPDRRWAENRAVDYLLWLEQREMGG